MVGFDLTENEIISLAFQRMRIIIDAKRKL
jgi:hypothetical protein